MKIHAWNTSNVPKKIVLMQNEMIVNKRNGVIKANRKNCSGSILMYSHYSILNLTKNMWAQGFCKRHICNVQFRNVYLDIIRSISNYF